MDVKPLMTEQDKADLMAAREKGREDGAIKKIARRFEAEKVAVLEARGVKENMRFDPKLKGSGLLDIWQPGPDTSVPKTKNIATKHRRSSCHTHCAALPREPLAAALATPTTSSQMMPLYFIAVRFITVVLPHLATAHSSNSRGAIRTTASVHYCTAAALIGSNAAAGTHSVEAASGRHSATMSTAMPRPLMSCR
eukprot:5309-Heterococcus_DN1.PRE.2